MHLHTLRAANRGWQHFLRERSALRRETRLRNAAGKLFHAYLDTERRPQLHCGTGPYPIDGWLNTDLEPEHCDVGFLNICEQLPFEDAVFYHSFSEHLIEHVSFEHGQAFLQECFRTLRPGGVLRVVTPDLAQVIRLQSCNDADCQRYLEEFQRHHASRLQLPLNSSTGVINALCHAWGHRFLYDEALLRSVLTAIGFVDVERCRVGESRHAELVGLERHAASVGEFMNCYESLILEGTRA